VKSENLEETSERREMKLAPITVFMFRDSEGFASAISQAISSSSFTRL